MYNGSRTAHGDPRPARTPSRQMLPSYFFWILDEAVTDDYIRHWNLYVVSLCCIPFMGNDPPQFSGTW